MFIERSPRLREALGLIERGFFSFGDPDRYRPIVDSLRGEDRYLVCADFDGYFAAEALAAQCYVNRLDWSRRALFNVSGASRFSADDTIRQYADQIWGVHPLNVDLRLLPRDP
jgi:starch phosphorylase